jgi:hypothetical protein
VELVGHSTQGGSLITLGAVALTHGIRRMDTLNLSWHQKHDQGLPGGATHPDVGHSRIFNRDGGNRSAGRVSP